MPSIFQWINSMKLLKEWGRAAMDTYPFQQDMVSLRFVLYSQLIRLVPHCSKEAPCRCPYGFRFKKLFFRECR